MEYHYKKLVGEKVYLSPASLNDAEEFVVWMNDMNITDYTNRTHAILALEPEKDWVKAEQTGNNCFLSIVSLETEALIGNISLNNINYKDRTATLGIMIGKDENRSKGYGTEAIGLLLDFAFNYLNLNNVGLTLLECNTRAKKCYEKAGFKEYGRRRKSHFINGKYYDVIYMDILASEFTSEFIKNKNVK